VSLSVCLSLPFVDQELERRKKFMFYGSLKFSEWWCNFEIKRSKDKVTVYENVKGVFRSYPREQWIGLIYFKPAPK